MNGTDTIENIWRECRRYLSEKLVENTFALYIEPLVPVKMDGAKVVLGIQNETAAAWIEQSFKDLILEALKKVTGRDCKLVVESDMKYSVCLDHENSASVPAATLETSSKKRLEIHCGKEQQDDFSSAFNHRDTFETFVVGACNRYAHGACLAVSERPGEAYNPLFLYGGTGLGKTHLLQAIGQEVKRRNHRAKVEYLSGEEFCNQFVDALRSNTLPAFRNRYRKVDVLLLDDLQFFSGKKSIQEEFFNTFNTLFNNRKQIVLTADRQVRQIKDLEERMVSRFEWGLTADVQPPDYETRLAILRKKQEFQTLKFSDKILELIAMRIHSNVRKLEAALFNLVSRCSLSEEIPLTPELLTVEKADELLGDMFMDEEARVISVSQIQKSVAEFYGLKMPDLMGKARPANIAFPRQIAMYLARQLTTLSFPAIAEQFKRNHSTILHAVGAVGKKMEESQEFKREIQLLERQLKSQ